MRNEGRMRIFMPSSGKKAPERDIVLKTTS
jgi:hypothetical protein